MVDIYFAEKKPQPVPVISESLKKALTHPSSSSAVFGMPYGQLVSKGPVGELYEGSVWKGEFSVPGEANLGAFIAQADGFEKNLTEKQEKITQRRERRSLLEQRVQAQNILPTMY